MVFTNGTQVRLRVMYREYMTYVYLKFITIKKGKSRENLHQKQGVGLCDIYFEKRCKTSCNLRGEQAEISRAICTGKNG